MHAVQVTEYGDTEVLKIEEIQRPQPQAGEVLVRIKFAGVLPIDWKLRKGFLHAVFPKTFPYTPGSAASGIVEAVGPEVTAFQIGDSVFGSLNGAYAEYGIASADVLTKMPEGLSFEAAAAIEGGATSAWKALFSEGELEAGQTVLIHAAAGGVGQFAVQLAKWKGATVIGTASTANLEYVRALGADQVTDYTAASFDEVVKDIDLVVDSVGGETEDRSWSVLKPGGILVALTQQPSETKAKEHKITAKFNTKFPTRKDVETISQLIADGTILAEIDSVYPLSEVQEAHKRSEARHGRGRILLKAEV